VHAPVDRPGTLTIVAELAGTNTIIGEISFTRHSASIYRITDVHVAPQHRRRGIGTALVRAAAEHAFANGGHIRMTLDEGNLSGRAFLAAVGLRQSRP
jgi:ribosomal protein S18 acetylase RimI-like enzyme